MLIAISGPGSSNLEDELTGVGLEMLALHLERPPALLRLAAKRLKIEFSKATLSISDTVNLIRYFSIQKYDQTQVLERQAAVVEEVLARQLEYAFALEILQRERFLRQNQVQQIQKRLEIADQRNDRLKGKLNELVQSPAYLIDQRDRLVAKSKRKSRTQVSKIAGRDVMLLKDPVEFSD